MALFQKHGLKSKEICLHDSDRRTMLSDGQWLYGTELSAM